MTSARLRNFIAVMWLIAMCLSLCAAATGLATSCGINESHPAAPEQPPASSLPTVPPGPEHTRDRTPNVDPGGRPASSVPPLPNVDPGHVGDHTDIGDTFDANRRSQSELIPTSSNWHAPTFFTVDKTQEIGFSIGREEFSRHISEMLPQTTQTAAGTIAAGPDMRATLQASPEDATVSPSGSTNTSTDSDIELAWRWTVTPKRPTDSLLLNVHLEVPLSGETVFTTDIPRRIPVHGTVSYYARQVFAHWTTWAAIATAMAGGTTWFYKRLKRPPTPAALSSHPPGGAEPAPPTSSRT